MPTFASSGVVFNYLDVGVGVPFVFQHGLGGDISQPARVFAPPPGVRLLSFDCRAHGETVWSSNPSELSFDAFSDDLIGLLDYLGIGSAVVGGVSMGAGVALNVAVRYPQRVRALVLSRPAWLDGPMPGETIALYGLIATLLRTEEPGSAAQRLEADPGFSDIATLYPDTASSLRGQLTSPRALKHVERLERMPRDQPISDLRDAAGIAVPTLVIAHHLDPVHPFEFGAALARTIPGARLATVTPKSVDPRRHGAEVQDALTFLLNTVTRPYSPR